MSVATSIIVSRHAEVRAVLVDPRFGVPAVPRTAAASGIAWLRAHVARFSTGADHERRRGLAVDELIGIGTGTLRRRAGERTAAELAAGTPVELMASVARSVPVGVLAEALGITGPIAPDVAAVSAAYQPGSDAGPAADAALARLVESFGGVADEATAARIGLLVQACDATAGLIGNSVLALSRGRYGEPTDAIVAETLRHDPPVRAMRRVSLAPAQLGGRQVPAGTAVRLDIAAANRDPAVFVDPDRFDPGRLDRARYLTFGEGLRPCPGSGHAFALAVGVVDAVRGRRVIDVEVDEDPSAILRVPARVVVGGR
jgi:cytochrome P450